MEERKGERERGVFVCVREEGRVVEEEEQRESWDEWEGSHQREGDE